MQTTGIVLEPVGMHPGAMTNSINQSELTQTLRGSTALVTGGSRGLGREAALRLAERGADVVVTYVKNESAAKDVVAKIGSLGVRAHAIQLDLQGTAGLAAFVRQFRDVLTHWGRERFEILVNNAGVSTNASLLELTEAEMDRQYETNLKSVVFLTQSLAPILSDHGRIIALGTGLTRVVFAPMIAYAAMKSAVETVVRYMAQDLGARGITVNAIAPGAIDNDFNRARFEAAPHVKDYIADNSALGRVGVPEDVGGVVAFLCSAEARFITGQRLEVSGGMKL